MYKLSKGQINDINKIKKEVLLINNAINGLASPEYQFAVKDYEFFCNSTVYNDDSPTSCMISVRVSSNLEEMLKTIFESISGYKIKDSFKLDKRFITNIEQTLLGILTKEEYDYIQYRFGIDFEFKLTYDELLKGFKIKYGCSEKELDKIRRSAFKKIQTNKWIKRYIKISNRDCSEDLDYKLARSINSMDISERTYKVLFNAGIKYVYDVSKMSLDDIASLKGAGKITISEIARCMYMDYHIQLKEGKKVKYQSIGIDINYGENKEV